MLKPWQTNQLIEKAATSFLPVMQHAQVAPL